MKMPEWLVNGDEEAMRKACQDPQVLATIMSVQERDMRALWIVEWNLKVIAIARKAGGWYRGLPSAASPETMLSQAVRPGGDVDDKLTHRLMALTRAYNSVEPLPTMHFTLFKVTSFMALKELKALRNFLELDEALQQLEEIFKLLDSAMKRKLALELLKELLTKKIESYAEVLRKIAAKFAEWERELLGVAETDVGQARTDAKLDELGAAVERVARRTKTPPASARTQAWVLEQWNYYSTHPEALGTNVTRRRVYVTDVWDRVKSVASAEHNIKTLKDFAKIKHTAQIAAERRAG